MKIDYKAVEIDVISFSEEDIIVTSCGTEVPTNKCVEVDFGLPVMPGMPQIT